ncbi:phospholipase D beta 1-like protein [Tanacetum coccineum]
MVYLCLQRYGYRMSLWAEHIGKLESTFDQPESLECVERVRSPGEKNWEQYAADKVTDMTAHHIISMLLFIFFFFFFVPSSSPASAATRSYSDASSWAHFFFFFFFSVPSSSPASSTTTCSDRDICTICHEKISQLLKWSLNNNQYLKQLLSIS